MTKTLEDRTQGEICLGPTGNLQGTYNFFSLKSGKKNYPRTIHKSTHPHDRHETCGGNGPSRKQNEGLIFENRTGATVNDILPDDEANEAFNKIEGNITGVEWEAEAETQEPATHTLQTYNNQYAALADEEENRDNNNESTGVDNAEKSQECDTTTKSQEWTATMRARNQEAKGKMTKRTNWHSLRRPSQKQNEILQKQMIY